MAEKIFVLCRNNKYLSDLLTVGKTYEALGFTYFPNGQRRHVEVLTDKGSQLFVPISAFYEYDEKSFIVPELDSIMSQRFKVTASNGLNSETDILRIIFALMKSINVLAPGEQVTFTVYRPE